CARRGRWCRAAALEDRRTTRHDLRVAPDYDGRDARPGIDVGERQEDLGRSGCRRPAPAAAAHANRIRIVPRRLDLEARVIEHERALVAGAAGSEIATSEKPTGPRRQGLRDLVAFRARRGN